MSWSRGRTRPWLITAGSVAARSAQLVVLLVIGNRWGASEITDDVFFLQAPLLVLAGIFVSSAQLVVMPSIHRADEHELSASMRRRLSRRALALGLPGAAVALLVGAAATGDASPPLLAVLLPIPALAALAGIEGGVLDARQRHLRAVLGPAYGGLLALVTAMLVSRTALGLAAVLLTFELGRWAGLSFHAQGLTRGEAAAPLPPGLAAWPGRRALLQTLAAALAALNLLVDVVFASRLPTGSVTQIEYASRLWNAVPLLFSGHLVVTYVRLSRIGGRPGRRKPPVGRTAFSLGLFAGLVSLALVAVAPWGIELLFGHGRLLSGEREILARLLAAYLLGAGPFVAGLVYVRALVAEGRPGSVAAVAGLGVLVNVVLDWTLLPILGVVGIGLATSGVYMITFLALFAVHRHRPPPGSAPEGTPG